MTAPTPIEKLQPLLLAPAFAPKCEVLFEIFSGELGRVELGRMLSGPDAGRLVTLRALPAPPSAELAAAVELARGIAHPKLAKVLGALRVADSWRLASEYIPAVTTFELANAAALCSEGVELSVAVRITLDTLEAALAAGKLSSAAGSAPARYVHPECVWVADFGETLLSEIVISAVLAERVNTRENEPPGEGAEAQDIRAAGLQLLELVCGSSGPSALESPLLPAALRQVVARATGASGTTPYESLRAFADDLAKVDPALLASDEEVSRELSRLVGSVLETRRQKLAMTERVSLQAGEEDDTKFFRAVAASPDRDTARPPPGTLAEVGIAGAISGKRRVAPRSEPPDEPTTIFRRPHVQDTVPDITCEPAPSEEASSARGAHETESWRPRGGLPAIERISEAPKLRSATRRRVAVSLLLLLAIVAFGLTSGSSVILRWLR